MTDDDRVLRLLGDVLDRQPTTAPDRLLTTVLDELQAAPQRRRWFLPSWRDLLTGPSLARLVVGGLAVAVIVVAMFQLTPRSALVGPGATSTSSPTIAPSAVSSPSPTPAPTAVSSPSTDPRPSTDYPTVTSHLPDGVEVEIPTGLKMHFTPAQVERMALDRIALEEQRLGRALLPARVLKVAVIPAGTVYWATRRDGTNPNGSGLGPDSAPGWVVVAEGTFVGVDHQTNTIVSHGTLGYFGFDDMENGGEGRIFIPCWSAKPDPGVELEGSCP